MYFLNYQNEKNKQKFNDMVEKLLELMKQSPDMDGIFGNNGNDDSDEKFETYLKERKEFYKEQCQKIIPLTEELKNNNIDWNYIIFPDHYRQSRTLFDKVDYKYKIFLAQREDFNPEFLNDLEEYESPAWFYLVIDHFNALENNYSKKAINQNFELEKDWELIKKILKKVDVNQTNSQNETILHVLAKGNFSQSWSDGSCNKKIDVFKYLLEVVDHGIRCKKDNLFINNFSLKKTDLINDLVKLHQAGLLDLNAETAYDKTFFFKDLFTMHNGSKKKKHNAITEIDNMYACTVNLVNSGYDLHKQNLKLLLSVCHKIHKLHWKQPYPEEKKKELIMLWEMKALNKLKKTPENYLSSKAKML